MELEQIIKAGRFAKQVFDRIPDGTLARVGLTRSVIATTAALPVLAVMPMTAAFVIGAAAGAGLLLAFAPGGREMRKALASRARHLRNRVMDVEADVEHSIVVARDKAADAINGRRTVAEA